MKVLVTGAAGYIGSHTIIELIKNKHHIEGIDNFSNSKIESLLRVEKITNTSITNHRIDIRNKQDLSVLFNKFKPDAVVHFAGLKSVAESVQNPKLYYENNISGTENLLSVMEDNDCRKLVFSSSATVYGNPQYLPINELHPLKPVNPYGESKLKCEQLIKKWSSLNKENAGISLRYFNPVGAHSSGMIGEDPNGTPNNIMPIISKSVFSNKIIKVYGDDYDTEDGTGERDYIHITDLAHSHLLALEYISDKDGYLNLNVGTGKSTSVINLIQNFEKYTNSKIKYKISARRDGDVAKSWACVKKSKKILGFETIYNIEDAIKSVWNWQTKNPNGYD